MQPTMKLRWRLANTGDTCTAFGTAWRNGFSDEWGELSGRVLQQWWAVYREGQETPTGQWIDIPLEEEE